MVSVVMACGYSARMSRILVGTTTMKSTVGSSAAALIALRHGAQLVVVMATTKPAMSAACGERAVGCSNLGWESWWFMEPSPAMATRLQMSPLEVVRADHCTSRSRLH